MLNTFYFPSAASHPPLPVASPPVDGALVMVPSTSAPVRADGTADAAPLSWMVAAQMGKVLLSLSAPKDTSREEPRADAASERDARAVEAYASIAYAVPLDDPAPPEFIHATVSSDR